MELDRLRDKPFYLDEGRLAWVKERLAGMSAQEKAGQLFCVLGDAESPESLAELVGELNVGGVLFRPAPAQELRRRFAELDGLAKLPLLKAANLEEGGSGALSDGCCFGSQMQAAAADDPGCTEDFALACAAEALSVGINWSFSPVVDVDMNFRNPITNVRTFGSDPDRVLENARIYVRTLQRFGIAAACKHFPGDGVDYRDQHLHPSYNDLSAEDWYASFGRIYKSLIDEGLLSVMAGHIVQPNVIRAIDPAAGPEKLLPGSQSRELLTGVLRERFGFNGLIISDATIMGGYTMSQPRRRAIPASIEAGCDMLCFGTDIREDIGYVLEGLENGLLSEARLDEAAARILALKARLSGEYTLPDIDIPAARRRCAGRAATLVKAIQGLVPLRPEAYPDIRLVSLGQDETPEGSLSGMAAAFLEGRGFRVERYEPLRDELHGTRGLPAGRLTLMLCNLPAASNQTTVRIQWCPKHALEIPRFVCEEATAFISFATPYHLQDVPRVRTYINAYTATRDTVEAALERLLGEAPFTGRSPSEPFCGLYDTRL